MKRPYPDIGDLALASYLNKLAFVKKFVRYWGTTTVDGVEVLVDRKYYYKSMDASTVKVTKLLGMYKDLKDIKMKGVKSAWLYLNANKDGITDLDAAILASNLDMAIGVDGITVDLVIGPKVGRAGTTYNTADLIAPPISNTIANQSLIIAEIEAEYATYWADGYNVYSTTKWDNYLDLLTRYVLLSTDVASTINSVSKTYTDVSVPYYSYDYDTDEKSVSYRTVMVDAYKVNISIDNFNFTDTTDMVVQIVADAVVGNPSSNARTTSISLHDSSSDDTDVETYITYPFNDTQALWHLASGSIFANPKRYLKASTLTSNVLTLDQKTELVRSVLDSGYREESREWWETLLVLAIFVVAVWLGQYWALEAGASALMAVAAGITMGALVLSLAAAAASAMGMTGFAMSASKFLKGIAPLVTIASIITIFGAIQNFAAQGAKKVAQDRLKQTAAEAATKEGAKAVAVEAAKVGFVESVQAQLGAIVGDLFSSSLSDVSMDSVISLTNTVFDAYQKQDLADIQKQIKDERSKLGEETQAKEESKTRHLLMDLMKVQYSPLNRDWSYYDNIYDKPYERWATDYHIGNIQAGTVNALWLADKKDGIM